MFGIIWGLVNWILFVLWYIPIVGFTLYIVVPLIVKVYPKIIIETLFLNRVCQPLWYLKLNEPEKVYGFKGAKSHKVESSSGSVLGVWHIPPPNEPASLSDASKVVIYCHGNAFHRGFDHRLELYRKLSKEGFHVITFDYSGFGDSSGWPSIKRVVEDATSVYQWAIKQVKKEDATVILWGHSLGTHISTRSLSYLCEKGGRMPSALVLEAPFTNSFEVADCFPVSKVFHTLFPFMRDEIHDIIRRFKSECPTEDYLPTISVPILILHAKDDNKVEIYLGEKLYEKTIANPSTKSRFIRFIRVHEKHDVKHYTARHPDAQSVFRKFVTDVMEFKGRETGSRDNRPANLIGPESQARFEFIDI